jgi:uncharacterized DUF497 family protein
MKFDYDSHKSANNKVKHGMDFAEAALVWSDENLSIVPMRSDTEPRFAADPPPRNWSTVKVSVW